MQNTLTKAINGDNQAERQLFELLFARFCRLAKYRVGEEDCEDMAQEACLTVLKKYRDLPPTAIFEAWAATVLRNVIGNHIQKERTVKKHVVDAGFMTESASKRSSDPKLRLIIIACLTKLRRHNPRYHEVLRLIHDGYTTNEICHSLSISSTNLYALLNRSRKVLRDCMTREDNVSK